MVDYNLIYAKKTIGDTDPVLGLGVVCLKKKLKYINIQIVRNGFVIKFDHLDEDGDYVEYKSVAKNKNDLFKVLIEEL